MSKQLEKTLQTVRSLPEGMQDQLAALMQNYIAEQANYDARTLTGLEQARRGEGVSVTAAREHLAKVIGITC